MPQGIRLWKVQNADLEEIKESKLNIEERIESWIEQDITIISDELLVIGRQVQTAFTGAIDIVCIDQNGDIIILELKRDKTPREVTAQILEYAAWIKDLSNEKITEIADDYFKRNGKSNLEEQFNKKFNIELPNILNEQHKMLIVASEMDSRSERIINYLSDTYGVSINAATFQYFQDKEGNELIGRVFLIEPTEVDYRTKTMTPSRRKSNLSVQELQEIARNNGTEELFLKLVNGLRVPEYFDRQSTTLSTVCYIGMQDGHQKTMVHIGSGESSSDKGLFFQIYIERFAEYFHVEKEIILQYLPSTFKEDTYQDLRRLAGYFKNNDEIERFLQGLADSKINKE